LHGVISIEVSVEQMRDQMLWRILVCHRDDVMRSRVRAQGVVMHQVGVRSGNANGCQNQAKSDDEEKADTHIVMLAYLPTPCHWLRAAIGIASFGPNWQASRRV